MILTIPTPIACPPHASQPALGLIFGGGAGRGSQFGAEAGGTALRALDGEGEDMAAGGEVEGGLSS